MVVGIGTGGWLVAFVTTFGASASRYEAEAVIGVEAGFRPRGGGEGESGWLTV